MVSYLFVKRKQRTFVLANTLVLSPPIKVVNCYKFLENVVLLSFTFRATLSDLLAANMTATLFTASTSYQKFCEK